MAKKTLRNRSFGEAMARIGEILASIQDGDTDIVAERVKEASELIAFCRAKLRKAEEDVGKILDSEN